MAHANEWLNLHSQYKAFSCEMVDKKIYRSVELLDGSTYRAAYDDHSSMRMKGLRLVMLHTVLKDHSVGHKNAVCQDRWSPMALFSQDSFHCRR